MEIVENSENKWIKPEDIQKPTKKKGSKKTALIIFLITFVLVIGAAVGVYFYLNAPVKFTTKDGKLSITMTRAFKQKDDPYLKIATNKAVFYADRLDFDLLELNGFNHEELDTVDVAYMDSSAVGGTVTVDKQNNLVYYEYVDADQNDRYYNLIFVFEGAEEYWFGCFYCFEEDRDNFRNQFLKWGATIEINNNVNA